MSQSLVCRYRPSATEEPSLENPTQGRQGGELGRYTGHVHGGSAYDGQSEAVLAPADYNTALEIARRQSSATR
jgi:hypothetical protein